MNPECRENSEDRRFEFDVDNDHFACPKCGNRDAPAVGLLVLCHLLIRDPSGPILGETGRFRLACHHSRAYLATLTNLEAATADPRIANCPGCLQAARKAGVKAPTMTHLFKKATVING